MVSKSNQIVSRVSLNIVHFLIYAVFSSRFPVSTTLATVTLVQSLLSIYSIDDKVSLWLQLGQACSLKTKHSKLDSQLS